MRWGNSRTRALRRNSHRAFPLLFALFSTTTLEGSVARKTILVCDNCGAEVGEGKGAALRVTYTDARRGAKAGGPLRRLRRQDARPPGRAPRSPAEVGRVAHSRGRMPGRPTRRSRMHRCRWRCWLARRTPGRSRGSSIATWRTSTREPYLVVPNRAEVDRVERDLLARRPALLGGTIGTFDDLFESIARGGGEQRRVATDAQRALVLRRVVAGASLNGLGASSRFSGFGDTLLGAISELESGLVDPGRGRGRSRRRSTPRYRDELEAPRARGSRPRAACARSSASRASCRRGTAGRCSRTASRT